jgi:hypothetical protein
VLWVPAVEGSIRVGDVAVGTGCVRQGRRVAGLLVRGRSCCVGGVGGRLVDRRSDRSEYRGECRQGCRSTVRIGSGVVGKSD